MSDASLVQRLQENVADRQAVDWPALMSELQATNAASPDLLHEVSLLRLLDEIGQAHATLQSEPLAEQRCHWYRNEVGLLLHVPFCAVSVSPTRAVPVIVGGDVFAGGAAVAGTAQTSIAPSTAPNPSSLVFTRNVLSVVFLVENGKTAEMGARSAGRRHRSEPPPAAVS